MIRSTRELRPARYALGLLLVVYVFNHVDRQILSILLEPIGRDLGASDSALGLLSGISFALFYTFAGIPIARWADRGSRRAIITGALAVWSGMTALCGLAASFWQLLWARVGVGVGEAGCTPPAHSVISDYFPPERRATAISTYQLGVPLGILVGLSLGGWIEQFFGWRMAFVAVGLPGLLLAVLVGTTLREPKRGQAETQLADTGQMPLAEALSFLWRLRSMRHMLIASSLQTFALAGAGTWNPAFLIRVHELSTGEVGTALGLIAGIAGGLGTFGGGWLADRMQGHDVRWYLWLPAIGAVVSIPLSIGFYVHPGIGLALALFVPSSIVSHFYSALSHAVAQSLVKVRMRAITSAVSLFMMNLLGYGLGPQAVGVASDLLGPSLGSASLQWALVGSTAVMLWAALHYVLAARTYRADLLAKQT